MVFSVLLVTAVNGQDRNDVIRFYNEGAKTVQTDVKAAISAFENVITVSDQVGESAADLRAKAVQVLPGLYFRDAYNIMNEKKPAPEIIQAAKKAVAAAEKYESASNKEKSERILIQGYNSMAVDFFSRSEFDNALLTFDSLLLISPDYLPAVYNKALIYRNQNNSDAFEETVDFYLGKLEAGKDDERAKQATALAIEYFRAAGSQANQANDLDEALVLLKKAEKYGEDKDLFYYFADVYNKQENFDNGAEYALKGLELETGDAEAKAKFYFQLGMAQAGKKQIQEACTSFKNSMYGAFAEASKAQRTNIKCE